MTRVQIGHHHIGYGQSPFIIAEAGVNHNGKLPLALKLVDAAAAAGADAVKFQTFKAGQVVTKAGQMASYQRKNIGISKSQMAMLKKLELQTAWYHVLRRRCRQKNIIFLSTPHGGKDSVDELQQQHVPAFKFGSGELTNTPVLAYAARLGIPMIIATGMATLPEVKEAVRVIRRAGNQKIIVLHATTNYPCPLEEVNLKAMVTMMKNISCPVGYSDHTIGFEVPLLAVALGACVIEKHLTLNRRMAGPDHAASTEPEPFREMVDLIRHVPTIFGSARKLPNPSERLMIPTVRKSIVTIRPISRGERFTESNLGIKRPGNGLSPSLYLRLLGHRSRRDLPADYLVTRRDYAPS